ncbi:Cap15 family cyclic dinucleotide receptor domain-containing protein [Hymenobacter yonginensis]|uniref:CD-NTase-associated protein 15 domain-containing protein n=1 Tax=Hymenobacter yonginensis TaxID=748197 RepID=A0ABY7PNC2_9BACT|nr:hypothetical protein [Hymenobacter yonginensis]WBO84737.1 hypothetical protein O9Z63_00500 [Hymenobacter yonginensis]
MIKHDLRTFGFAIIGLALATWFALIWYHHGFKLGQLDVSDFGQISSVVSINVLFWGLFIKYMWKWKIFKGWLIQVPDLSGTWEGQLISSWQDDNGETPDPIDAKATITQSLFHINVKIETKEMKSNSAASSLDIDLERGYKNLWYSYRSEPKASVKAKSPIHYGSVILRINEDESILEGQYWTDRKTIGDLILTKVST